MQKNDHESFFKPSAWYLTKQNLFSLHNGILQEFALHQKEVRFLHMRQRCWRCFLLDPSLRGIFSQKSRWFEGNNPTEALESGTRRTLFPGNTFLSFVVGEAAEPSA
jgi:hypothetical protein